MFCEVYDTNSLVKEVSELGLIIPLDISLPVLFRLFFSFLPCGCLQFVIVVFPDHAHLLFLSFH